MHSYVGFCNPLLVKSDFMMSGSFFKKSYLKKKQILPK